MVDAWGAPKENRDAKTDDRCWENATLCDSTETWPWGWRGMPLPSSSMVVWLRKVPHSLSIGTLAVLLIHTEVYHWGWALGSESLANSRLLFLLHVCGSRCNSQLPFLAAMPAACCHVSPSHHRPLSPQNYKPKQTPPFMSCFDHGALSQRRKSS